MAEAASKILEGVFAIDKPPSLSSAQVLRDLQTHFAPSRLFAPLVQQTQERQEENDRFQSKRRKRNASENLLKMGHGGTLDPLATGVLIIGVGKSGTVRLGDFLGCTKTYETVVLFGKSTDTFDIAGKVVADAPYQGVTRELVEKKLSRFRGKIKQVPPIYSALKINGMKAYEYARSGKELPRELESRDMEVVECEMLEWYEGGEHEFRWPAEEAADEDKSAAKKLMGSVDSTETVPAAPPPTAPSETSPEALSPTAKAKLHTHEIPTLSSSPCPAPAARIRLSVSSGFYVRSFAHDLGRACSSFGIMASLVRSRQAEFTCTEQQENEELIKALTYDELKAGEEVWGPRVKSMLDRWMKTHPSNPDELAGSHRRSDRDSWNSPRRGGYGSRPRESRSFQPRRQGANSFESKSKNGRPSDFGSHIRKDREVERRRNSSSPE